MHLTSVSLLQPVVTRVKSNLDCWLQDFQDKSGGLSYICIPVFRVEIMVITKVSQRINEEIWGLSSSCLNTCVQFCQKNPKASRMQPSFLCCRRVCQFSSFTRIRVLTKPPRSRVKFSLGTTFLKSYTTLGLPLERSVSTPQLEIKYLIANKPVLRQERV